MMLSKIYKQGKQEKTFQFSRENSQQSQFLKVANIAIS